MKALRSFAVRAALPSELAALRTIAYNLRWTWNPQALEVFRWVDADAWESSGHDPVRMLGEVPRERLEELATDGPFLSFLADVGADLEEYLEEPRWYQGRSGGPDLRVAYFSPEFGVGEALPIYSGGLGVLAGDHLKAASDLGAPLVAVGLLYRQGYFRQELANDGWQQERYPALDPHAMPLTLLHADGRPVKVDVDLAGARCVAQVWRADVGRVPLLLLDCDVEENDPAERLVTDRLYGGSGEHRLRQEIVLGIGGVRALAAAGLDANVFHSNEGHAGFMGLERIRCLVQDDGLAFATAVEVVRASTVFTTHTPVPAGIDVFSSDLMERYFTTFAKECGVSLDELMRLGRSEQGAADVTTGATFNMAVMGLHLAARANGVSRLHGETSRQIFADVWPGVPPDEVPIGHITNGVHTSTWTGSEIRGVLSKVFSPAWPESGAVNWGRVDNVADAELWRARERARERLVDVIRARIARRLQEQGVARGERAWVEDVLDPRILTIGFARRFAQYKRGALLLTDPERLKALLLSEERPVQILFAGKAHPSDDGGKEMIRRLVQFASDPAIRRRLVFLPDYDMELGRALTQGCDLWLNNPRRPLEACGTSGMKAALNGALNCSVLDGWWDECYDGRNGWAITTFEGYGDPDGQDAAEAGAVYDLLEREIVPRFYERDAAGVPRAWTARMKASMVSLGPFVTADRMVRDYIECLYEPAALHGTAMVAQGFAQAEEFASWKQRVLTAWEGVAVEAVEGEVSAAQVGEARTVRAVVRLGSLTPDDVVVQLAHGRVGATGELQDPVVAAMTPTGDGNGTYTFEGDYEAGSAGLYGFSVRVVPRHDALPSAMDLGVVAWA